MQITMRLDNDNYLDLYIDIKQRELVILSPIPNITLEELMQLSDEMHYKIYLPITEHQITPDDINIPTEEIDRYYTYDTKSALTLVLGLCNSVISEH